MGADKDSKETPSPDDVSTDASEKRRNHHTNNNNRRHAKNKSTASATSVSIPEFFENRSVFVTGGTGYIGKLLIEKLLRSCPGVNKIYVLVRPKRKQDVEQRMKELLFCQLFDGVRKNDPLALEKVVGVRGNLMDPSLGISEIDEAAIVRDVSVIFHSAATINFEEPLKSAVAMNLNGTMSIIQLCNKLASLAAFVHLSTAFFNCEKYESHEQFYPAQHDPEHVLSAASWLSESVMDDVFKATRGNKPNTYIFTKALAESLIEKRAAGLPVAIVRPSIVGPTRDEPIPGWIDSPNGPVGIFLAAGNGLFTMSHCDGTKRADMVPADYVVNVMVAAAWRAATNAATFPSVTASSGLTSKNQEHEDSSISIYNITSGIDNPITWGHMMEIALKASQVKYPFETAVFYPNLTLTMTPWVQKVNAFVFQLVPAYILDTVARWSGKPARLMRIQKKLLKAHDALAYFCTQEWDFHSTNTRQLLDCLVGEDRKVFNFDIKRLVWKDYLETGLLGARTYYLGQSPSSIPACVDRLARLNRMRIILKISSLFFLLVFVVRLLSLPRKIYASHNKKQQELRKKALSVACKNFA